VALEGVAIWVPAVWSLEIANAILSGERAKRVRQPEIRRFTALLEGLPIVQDAQSPGEHASRIPPIAREHGLSAYDAAYLELSMRRGASIATLDGKLQKAARRAGVEIFGSA
jgi:predicted nucleic acid-binding protein